MAQINTEEATRKTARAIIEYLLEHQDIQKNKMASIKGILGKPFGYKCVMKDSVVRSYATPEEQKILSRQLRRRYTRTLSGVTIVAVMTKPHKCPGNCIFCPGPDSQPGEKVAQSYTGREPAAMRSAMYHYDPYEQTFHRMQDLVAIGHQVDKLELIVMGGTFLYTPQEYQDSFIKGCYDAIINFAEPDFNGHQRTKSLAEAKKKLETATTRLIGLTFETRPDYCFEPDVDRMLELGATRVEIGVQTTIDSILEFVHRGHLSEDSIKAIRVAKDGGLKVNAHIMPDLPGSTPDSDIEVFRELFNNHSYRPDMLKIYPCLVVEGTKLFELYQKGEYQPYSQEEIIRVISTAKAEVPRYVRIQRIQRDIPATLIIDGIKNSNLRQMVTEEMKKHGQKCHCIRCREEGFTSYTKGEGKDTTDLSNVKLHRLEYEASEGKEIFISFEDMENDVLIGFVRLRFPSLQAHRPEFKNQKTAIVREIRVVGEIVKHDNNPDANQIQHRGYGKRLMAEAEKVTLQYGYKKLFVIAGIGVRPYFYKQGYKVDGPYVSKVLDTSAETTM